MSYSKTRISGTRRPTAFRSLVTASLSLLLLTVGSTRSPVQAAGPALWIASPQQTGVAGSRGGVIELRPGQLLTSGTPHQVKLLGALPPLANAAGLAFQNNGNLWVTTLDNLLLKYIPTQLQNLSVQPHPKPAATITSSAFGFNIGCAFDAHKNLWIVDAQNEGVHEISHAQLIAGTADITPAVTITDATDLASPAFATFDTAGNLWLSSEANSEIVEFAASQLTTGGTLVPNVIISSPSVDGPGQMAFDTSGNLWVTNSANATVAGFTPSQLAASGSPAANVVITVVDGAATAPTPWGLQFDQNNRLWVFDYTSGDIVKYAPVQLTASGSPTPRITLTGLPLFAAQLAFGPRY
jgi:sugar lactone lactonase YvrE